MSAFTVIHTCGHHALHHCETEKQRQQREALLRTLPCEACNQAARAAAKAAHHVDLGLPDLSGDAENLRWAEVIRLKAVEHNHEYYQQLLAEDPFQDDPTLRTTALTAAENALQELHAIQDAHWWVEHREATLDFVKYRIAAALHALNEPPPGSVGE